MRESRNFEFKTGGGAYPIQILPEVRHSGDSVLCFTIILKSKVDQSCIMPGTKLFFTAHPEIRFSFS